jgi:hypothetical protein
MGQDRLALLVKGGSEADDRNFIQTVGLFSCTFQENVTPGPAKRELTYS